MSEESGYNPDDPQVFLYKRFKDIKNKAEDLIAPFQESDPEFAQELIDLWQAPGELDMKIVERIRREMLENT